MGIRGLTGCVLLVMVAISARAEAQVAAPTTARAEQSIVNVFRVKNSPAVVAVAGEQAFAGVDELRGKVLVVVDDVSRSLLVTTSVSLWPRVRDILTAVDTNPPELGAQAPRARVGSDVLVKVVVVRVARDPNAPDPLAALNTRNTPIVQPASRPPIDFADSTKVAEFLE